MHTYLLSYIVALLALYTCYSGAKAYFTAFSRVLRRVVLTPTMKRLAHALEVCDDLDGKDAWRADIRRLWLAQAGRLALKADHIRRVWGF